MTIYSPKEGELVSYRRYLKKHLELMLTTWINNIRSFQKTKFRSRSYTSLNQPVKNIGSGLSEPEIASLPRLPHLKEKTAAEIFPVGWKLYTLPETNLYKLVEIKFDNRFKSFAGAVTSARKMNTGKFLTEFFKCLVMDLIEWDWGVENPKLDIVHSTYKRCLGWFPNLLLKINFDLR